jgi:hypothetical protein
MVGSICYTLFVALQTKTQWLAVVASLAGLVGPFLINFQNENPVLLLSYLLLLSACFLVVAFFTSWRAVSLTLLIGTALHTSVVGEATALNDNALWFFVILFSILFFTSTTVSVIGTKKPVMSDVVSVVIISLQFIGYTIALAPIPEVAALAMFIAGSVTAFVGYILRKQGADVNSVSLYVAISLALSLIGTSLLLDGFALTLAYAVEVLAIYVLSLSLATAKRSIIVAACLFILPIISGFNDLGSYVWQNGIIHPEALGALSVILTLGFAVVWSLRNSALQSVDWLRKIAGTLLVIGYVFALSTIMVVGESQQVLDPSFIKTLLLSLLSGVVIIYILLAVKRVDWRLTALFTLFAPTVSAFILLNHSAWNSDVFHQPFWAVLLFYIGLISTAVLYRVFAKRESEKSMFTFAYSVVWVILVFGFFFVDRIWNTLLDGDLYRVLNSISFTLLIYLVVNCLMLAKANAGRVTAILVTLILPAMLLLASLKFWGWSDGMFGVDAVALYVTTTILFLVGTTIRQYKNSVSTDNEKELLDVVGYGLYAVAGFLVFSLVWIMSQTAFASDGVAITVALFIYTVAGLASYSYGRVATSSVWRKIGILLLVTVVLRLGLIDFWGMDPVWKIVTFLGIGILFIATALMERSRDNSIGK